MKKVWFLGLLAAAILAGCSDNDDNGGDEVKPGDGQVESPYLPQRIAQVKVFKDGEISDSVCCYYDTRGRVNLVESYELGMYDDWDGSSDGMFYYFEDYLIGNDYSAWFYNILNGKVVTGYGDKDKIKYKYEGDCLQSLRVITTFNERYTREHMDTLMMDFSFLKDNLDRYAVNRNDHRFQVVFEYGNHANMLNIDMFYFLMRYVFYFHDLSGEVFWGNEYNYGECEEDFLYPWLLGIAGERSACLPEAMEVTRSDSDGEEKRAYTYKYTMKGEYVSEMAILDASGKEAYRFVFSYKE